MIDHHTVDPENMHKSIFEFPDHIIEALELGNKITLHNNYENCLLYTSDAADE